MIEARDSAGVRAAPEAPPWAMWMLDHVQAGLLVLSQDGLLLYANQWIKAHTQLVEDAALGKPLAEVFPTLQGSYFHKVLCGALRTGFASVLSNSMHGSPFPLYQAKNPEGPPSLVQQSIHIMPMGAREAAQTGQRCLLIQINDVTQAVNRERLLKAHAHTLHGMARMDALTGISNRRHFDETLANEFRHAMRERRPMSLLLADLDNFKAYNDTYGHVRGDEVLTLVADAMRRSCNRPRDLAARYGGEEIVLTLPDTDAQGAHAVAMDLQSKVRQLEIEHLHNAPTQRLTISIGIATLTHPADGLSAKELLEQADLALYQAKRDGRNRISGYNAAASPCPEASAPHGSH